MGCAKLNKLVKLRGNVGVVYEVIIWESIGQMYVCAKKQRRQDSIGPAATNISNPKDEKVEETEKNCVDLYQDTQAKCDAANGVWTSTSITEAQCLATTRCQTKGGWTDEKPADECTKCGGTNVPSNHWHTGTWKTPAMVSSTVS